MKKYLITEKLLLAIFCLSCLSNKLPKRAEPPQFDTSSARGLFVQGQYYLKHQSYENALESFVMLMQDFEEDSLADDAQFLIAEILSNPKYVDYDLAEAISEYENLIDNYPNSPYVKIAEKRIRKIEKKLEQEE